MGNCCQGENCKPIVISITEPPQVPQQQQEPADPIDQNNIKPFTLDGQICLAHVVDVYDGDTCTVNMKTSAGHHQWKIRMLGYDCPEIRLSAKAEPDEHQREVHKLHGKVCGNLLRKMILGKTVWVKCSKFEKFGRVLGDIYVYSANNIMNPLNAETKETKEIKGSPNAPDLSKLIHVNKWMLENTSAQPYDGGAHKNFDFGKFYSIEYKDELRRLLNV